MTELCLKDEDRELQEWVDNQNFDEKEKVLWKFHRWMRQKTDLGSGTIIDYRKYVAGWLDEDGGLVLHKNDEPDLTSHEQAAIHKFRKFRKETRFVESPYIVGIHCLTACFDVVD